MKKLILVILNLIALTNVYSINKQDSIYYDLYRFLVSQGRMEGMTELSIEDCGQYIYLFDVRKDNFPNKPNIDVPFGIYKFQYAGYVDGGYYVLIKYKESYKVYYQNNLSWILRELIRIRKESPDLMDENLFMTYLDVLLNDQLGVYGGGRTIVQKIGNIEYYN